MKYIIGVVVFLAVVNALSGDSSSTGNNYESNDFIEPTVYVAPTRYDYPVYEDSSEPEYFNGYPCTEDCSGHEAGYEWAEENDIEDPDECDGNSDSFIEGCMSYVEENYSDYSEEDYEYDY